VSACRDLEDYGITCVVRGCPLLAKLNMAHSRYVRWAYVLRSMQCCVVLCAVMCVQLSGHRAGVVRAHLLLCCAWLAAGEVPPSVPVCIVHMCVRS
jgi:hypothetical protein